MRLAVDVMGGDHAPDEILKGCILSLNDLAADDRLVLIGPQDIIEDTLHERRVDDPRIEIHHTTQIIEMHESPVEAVKGKPDSTIVRMAVMGSQKAQKQGLERCDAIISAGNTGACVSAATMHMRRLPGVHRPGIAVTIPSFGGPLVLCDAGANPEPRPSHLAQYAVMAETYSRHMLGVATPRIAQINIGAEDSKGTGMTKRVRDLLYAMPGVNYIGYIEGREFLEGAADVIVCDGFVGNVMLKLAEGLAQSFYRAIFQAIFDHDADLAMQLEPVAKDMFKRNDYQEYGGAPLLGVNGVCMICHGSAKARSIAAAIRRARSDVDRNLNDAIVRRIADVARVIDAPSDELEANPA